MMQDSQQVRVSGPDEDVIDDLDAHLDELHADPAFRAAYADAEASSALLGQLLEARRQHGLAQVLVRGTSEGGASEGGASEGGTPGRRR